ncbi:hypothetical protein A3H38_01545 [candidate division WOR-1 bacterium RIFCSPLOWO2_02_FULL_46_20]|uniref:Uncharacterized protein n=1 Tax=candidate division WOR-1 bacterium RIFCSPLOWO2_02_FULL_46_20 TaxID=1802567 RepID=A0A1F4RE00_UNCSA|nr:MAG: hypothetical protein A3H38_01545 [candidate division WOR-1 bacterium RIFCSPLOWO2_02_FULL_46_20]
MSSTLASKAAVEVFNKGLIIFFVWSSEPMLTAGIFDSRRIISFKFRSFVGLVKLGWPIEGFLLEEGFDAGFATNASYFCRDNSKQLSFLSSPFTPFLLSNEFTNS